MNSATIAITPGAASASIAGDPPLFAGISSFAVEGAVVVIVSESVPFPPEPLSTPKLHFASLGNPLHENWNVLLVKPDTDSVVTPEEPDATLSVEGLPDIAGVAVEATELDGALCVPGRMPTHSVMVCTRLPLVAKIVTGTVCHVADEYAVSVSLELPLTSVDGLNDAVTPEGSPGAESVTVPKPNDLTCSGTVSVPADMVYEET